MPKVESVLPIIISVAALLVSIVTFWLTRMRKGTIRMTRPSVIFFGKDGGNSEAAKIFLRTLLYSTADKGQYIEGMYVKLTKDNAIKTFNIWAYGEKGQLKRGSGLFVGKHGIEADHHFLLPKQARLDFKAGDYILEVYAELVNKKPKRIFSQSLTISKKEAKGIIPVHAGLYFDWLPDDQSYHTYLEDRTAEEYMKRLRENPDTLGRF
ncbi:MAG TPA: hypothetical protein VJR27_00065 [Candidatus Saccharimonadales bacterium]|nr:hypothetical protein [Candidatus Saccharimonadales bacterium]